MVGAVGVAAALQLPTASAAPNGNPIVPDGYCVRSGMTSAQIVDALRFHCSPQQADGLFFGAQPGPAPTGVKRFWVLPAVTIAGQSMPYPFGRAFAAGESVIGDGLTFGSKNGAAWVQKNYTVGGKTVGGALQSGVSFLDHRPVWTIDFRRDSFGVPVSYHEFRQIAPDVWLGWSYFLQDLNPVKQLPVHGSYVITS